MLTPPFWDSRSQNPANPDDQIPSNANNAATASSGPVATPSELAAAVTELLNGLSNKFAGVSSEIYAKRTFLGGTHCIFKVPNWHIIVDDMQKRLDILEASLEMQSAGEERESSVSPRKKWYSARKGYHDGAYRGQASWSYGLVIMKAMHLVVLFFRLLVQGIHVLGSLSRVKYSILQ